MAEAARRYDIVQRELARLGSSDRLDPVGQCALALQAQAADALEQIWRAAELAGADESLAHELELALILIHLIPALGLATLAHEACTARGLAGEDRSRQLHAAVRREQAHAATRAANARVTELRAALDRTLDRNRQLKRRIDEIEEQIRRQATTLAGQASRAAAASGTAARPGSGPRSRRRA